MGLFDGIEAGWNSFKNNELKSVSDAVNDLSKPIWARDAAAVVIGEDRVKQNAESWNKTTDLKYILDQFSKPIWARDAAAVVIGEDRVKQNAESWNQTVEDADKPIWEREGGKELIGEENAQKITDTLNPDNWSIPEIIPTDTVDKVKKYLPAVLIGGVALFLISALK